MPICSFRYHKCLHAIEQIQLYHDSFPECPLCGSKMTRLLGTGAFKFKGSGFHCTDYTMYGKKKI
jgi:putative FmdB family regulatory protein